MKVYLPAILPLILTCILPAGALGTAATEGGNVATGQDSRTTVQSDHRRRDIPALDGESTLSDYLAYAAMSNPGLEAAFDRWQAALEKIPQAGSLPDPRINYSWYIREVETRVGPQRQRVGLSQMFPWFGKRGLRKDIAFEDAAREEKRYEGVKLQLFYRVKTAYLEYGYLGRSIEILKENIALVTRLENLTRNRYSTARASYADLIRLEIEREKLQDRLNSLLDLRVPLEAGLNAALNRTEESPLPFPADIPGKRVALSPDEIVALFRENNPTLRGLDRLIEKERKAATLAGKGYFPDVTLGLHYIDTGPSVMADAQESGKDPLVASISFNLPLWFGKYRAEERERKKRHHAAMLDRREEENLLLAELTMACYNLEDAGRRITLYGESLVPRAEKSLAVAEKAFTAGAGTYLDVMDAQKTLLEFRLARERARVDYVQRLAEIEMIAGAELPLKSPEVSGAVPKRDDRGFGETPWKNMKDLGEYTGNPGENNGKAGENSYAERGLP